MKKSIILALVTFSSLFSSLGDGLRFRDATLPIKERIDDPEARITQPIKLLKHFEKTELKLGKNQRIIFEIDPEKDLSIPGCEGERILESGVFIL